jgi:hypothetical protein
MLSPSPYDRLAIPPTATPAEVKAAYHIKLKEFPAHLYPEEFKEIRAAYETIRKGGTSQDDFFFLVRPLEAKLDSAAVVSLRERMRAQLKVSLKDMIRETF